MVGLLLLGETSLARAKGQMIRPGAGNAFGAMGHPQRFGSWVIRTAHETYETWINLVD